LEVEIVDIGLFGPGKALLSRKIIDTPTSVAYQ